MELHPKFVATAKFFGGDVMGNVKPIAEVVMAHSEDYAAPTGEMEGDTAPNVVVLDDLPFNERWTAIAAAS
jgi:hypothetical protein